MIEYGWSKFQISGNEWFYLKGESISSPIYQDDAIRKKYHEKAVKNFLDYGASCGYDTMSPIERYFKNAEDICIS